MKQIIRYAGTAVALVAVTFVLAMPAHAGTNASACTPTSCAGTVTWQHSNNSLRVNDNAADGKAAAAGHVFVIRPNGTQFTFPTMWVTSGAGTSRTFSFADQPEGSRIQFDACLGNGSAIENCSRSVTGIA
jgi:hypothetical protein